MWWARDNDATGRLLWVTMAPLCKCLFPLCSDCNCSFTITLKVNQPQVCVWLHMHSRFVWLSHSCNQHSPLLLRHQWTQPFSLLHLLLTSLLLYRPLSQITFKHMTAVLLQSKTSAFVPLYPLYSLSLDLFLAVPLFLWICHLCFIQCALKCKAELRRFHCAVSSWCEVMLGSRGEQPSGFYPRRANAVVFWLAGLSLELPTHLCHIRKLQMETQGTSYEVLFIVASTQGMKNSMISVSNWMISVYCTSSSALTWHFPSSLLNSGHTCSRSYKTSTSVTKNMSTLLLPWSETWPVSSSPLAPVLVQDDLSPPTVLNLRQGDRYVAWFLPSWLLISLNPHPPVCFFTPNSFHLLLYPLQSNRVDK